MHFVRPIHNQQCHNMTAQQGVFLTSKTAVTKQNGFTKMLLFKEVEKEGNCKFLFYFLLGVD